MITKLRCPARASDAGKNDRAAMENRQHGSFFNLSSHSLKDVMLPEFSQFVLYDIFPSNDLNTIFRAHV